MKPLFNIIFFVFAFCNFLKADKNELIILQFNIWQEGTSVPGGYEAIVNEIDRLNPDFVTFSEVRNYNDTRFCDRIVSSLTERNKVYYSFYSDDSGLLSRFPIQDSLNIYSEKGTIQKLVTHAFGMDICVYTAHLDYMNYATYLPRGYDGLTWEKLPALVVDVDTILKSNLASQRDEALRLFIWSAEKDIREGKLVFIGGDFNEPSHLDWVEALKDSFDHHGCVIPWTSTIMLEEAGFLDSFRERYPDPVTYPGFTYPADNRSVEVSKLAWAPDADDRDRIDYIFYYPDKRIELKDCVIVGPDGSIIKNERMKEKSQDIFIKPLGIWPTDHKAVMVTFRIVK